ncbi:hypothetical protein [Litorimonas sp.]|uniref:hypothetical protein n=1 Tax=Litorimonas sp. TaxID=1892381 RepID=UPI003A853562
MSDTQTNTINSPIWKRNIGAVNVAVWEQQPTKGNPFYTVSFGKTYKDRETGQVRESRSFTQADMNQLPVLINEANHKIGLLMEAQRLHAQDQTPAQDTGLQTQRDQVMQSAKAAKANGVTQEQNQTQTQSHTHEM